MRKLVLTMMVWLATTSVALADYNLIIPQNPSGGTSVWAQIVVAEWEKHLGEKINLIYKTKWFSFNNLPMMIHW